MRLSNRFWLLALVAIAIFRLIFVWQFATPLEDCDDGRQYWAYSQAIRSGEWLRSDDFYGADRAPGYPFLVAILHAIFPDDLRVVYIVQVFFSIGTTLLIFLLARDLFSKTMALAAASWSAIYPFYYKYLHILLRESTEIFLLVALVLAIYRVLQNPRFSRTVLAAFLAFALVHVNAKYLFHLPILTLLFLQLPIKTAIRHALIFGALFLAFSLPWFWRNYALSGDIVVVNRDAFVISSTEASQPNVHAGYAGKSVIRHFEDKRAIRPAERLQILAGENPNGRSADELLAVQNNVWPDSTFWAIRGYQFLQFWRPAKFRGDFLPMPVATFNKWSLPHNLAGIFAYGILLPFAIFASFQLWRKNRVAFYLLLAPIFAQSLLHTLVWSRERYRVPVAAFIIILAAYGVVELWQRRRT